LNVEALLQLADAGGIGHMKKDYILGLADLPCHITKNPNPNCKRVWLSKLKNVLAYIKNFPIKRPVSISPAFKQQC